MMMIGYVFENALIKFIACFKDKHVVLSLELESKSVKF